MAIPLDVRIQLHYDRLTLRKRLKKVSSLPAGDRFLRRLNFEVTIPHVSRSLHVGNEICNYKLDT
jgi:hypothetical protein